MQPERDGQHAPQVREQCRHASLTGQQQTSPLLHIVSASLCQRRAGAQIDQQRTVFTQGMPFSPLEQ
ncbi:hypothetical protein D3C84_522220 [compost metagenome]